MKTVEIKLNESEIEQISKIDSSIRKHSVDFGILSLKLRSHESQLSGLYESRNKIFENKIADTDIDRSKIREYGLAQDTDNPGLAKIIISVED